MCSLLRCLAGAGWGAAHGRAVDSVLLSFPKQPQRRVPQGDENRPPIQAPKSTTRCNKIKKRHCLDMDEKKNPLLGPFLAPGSTGMSLSEWSFHPAPPQRGAATGRGHPLGPAAPTELKAYYHTPALSVPFGFLLLCHTLLRLQTDRLVAMPKFQLSRLSCPTATWS